MAWLPSLPGDATQPLGLRCQPVRWGGPVLAALESWDGSAPRQWNVSFSRAGVLRGLHLHVGCEEIYVLAQGRASALLLDLREGSPTRGQRALLTLDGERPQALPVPAGLVHGLYFHTPSLLLTGRSREHDGRGDLRCRWDVAEAGALPLPAPPLLSDADAGAGTLEQMLREASGLRVAPPAAPPPAGDPPSARPLEPRSDARGALIEAWRASWDEGLGPCPLELLRLAPGEAVSLARADSGPLFIAACAGAARLDRPASAEAATPLRAPSALRVPRGPLTAVAGPAGATLLVTRSGRGAMAEGA